MRFTSYFKYTIGFILGALLLSACQEKSPVPEVLRPVRYQTIYATGGDRMRTFSGVAQAAIESRLSFKVGGTIRNINVKVGDEVAPGQVIASLDDSDFRLQVQQAQASLESARAQARNASASYDRVRQLYENNNASRNDLDAARAAQESAEAQVRALEKQLELANSQLSYTRITAPVKGDIAAVDREVNENVQAGQSIVQLSSDAQMEVEVAIPEILIARLREGQKAQVQFDALPGKEFAATITEVGVSSTGFATTFPVTVRLDRNDPDIRPGMAAEVGFNFSLSDQKERFLVPLVALGEDRQGRFVYVVEPAEQPGEGIVHRTAVMVGDLENENVEILEGLIDGSRVVTAGVSQLADSQRVKFLESPAY